MIPHAVSPLSKQKPDEAGLDERFEYSLERWKSQTASANSTIRDQRRRSEAQL